MRLSSRVGLLIAVSMSVASASVAGSFKVAPQSNPGTPFQTVAEEGNGLRMNLAAFLPIGISHAGAKAAAERSPSQLNELERRALIDRVRAKLVAKRSQKDRT